MNMCFDLIFKLGINNSFKLWKKKVYSGSSLSVIRN